MLRGALAAAGALPLTSRPRLARAEVAREVPRPLLRRYPRLEAALPWMDLGGLPTPISRAEALGERLGLEGGLWIKRDDQAGALYGGSKARKLEHLLAEVVASGTPEVLTFGGVGSNHALATAVQARRLGLDCVLALLPERPSDHARQHLLAERRLGCEQIPARGTDAAAARQVLARRPAEAERPAILPAGGTSPLGNVGYVNGAFELAEQCDAGLVPVPEVIYVAGGTMGTAAGLAIGLAAAGLPTRLEVVRASNPGTGSVRRLRAEIDATVELLRRLEPGFPPAGLDRSRVHLEHGAAGEGYAIPSQAGRQVSSLARALEGLELDLTYTAKAMAALRADAPRLTSRRVLFWNTYDPRPVSTEGVSPSDLPRPFQRYFPPSRR